MTPNSRRTRVDWKIILVILMGVVLQLVLNHLPKIIQHQYGDLFRATIVLLVGGAISYLVEHWLQQVSSERIGARRATSLRFLARLVLYLAIALALLAAFGVGLSSVIFGSAFLTVILGLAGQSFFSNLIAGIGLIIFHPFEVGDHISFVTSQYPLMVPSYAHEAMKPAYSGVVTDINLAYTTLETDDGNPMQIPNGVLIQAAIHNHQRRQRRQFRFRFDLALDLEPTRLIGRLQDLFKDWPYPIDVKLADVGASTFALVILAQSNEPQEDVVRHAILSSLVPLVQELRGEMPSSDSH